jgi:hypothetical protein
MITIVGLSNPTAYPYKIHQHIDHQYITTFFSAVDANSIIFDFPFVRALIIRAKLFLGVHPCHSQLAVWKATSL